MSASQVAPPPGSSRNSLQANASRRPASGGSLRVGASTLISIGAIAALVALGVTVQVLPDADPRTLAMRPWVAARAMGITAYLLLGFEVALGIVLSHPNNLTRWHKTKQVFPWHEMVTVFTGAFIALHVALLAVDPYAKVGVIGALVPGFSEYRPVAVGVGSVALYATDHHRRHGEVDSVPAVRLVAQGPPGGGGRVLPDVDPRGARGDRRRRPAADLHADRRAHPRGRRPSLVDREATTEATRADGRDRAANDGPAGGGRNGGNAMTGVWWKRLVRRLGVIALTVGVIGISVGTVRLAAQWRAEAAPLDVSPVSMDTIVEAAQRESDRATHAVLGPGGDGG